MTKKKSSYDVGYMKPPVETRFKTGQSGNPKGRKKGRKDFQTEVREILEAPVKIMEGGKEKRVSSRAATVMRLRERALKGDQRAIDRMILLAIQHASEEDAAGRERNLTLAQEDILARYVETHKGNPADQTKIQDGSEMSADIPESDTGGAL